MYDNLLILPYFQGLSKKEITTILDKVAFDFVNYKQGETIYHCGDDCNKFSILIKGEMLCIMHSQDNSYSLCENIDAPYAIEPYSLFGGSTKYKRNYIAESDCSILCFDKHFLFNVFTQYDIFTINLLNIISNKAQQTSNLSWEEPPTSIEGRIAQFIAQRCECCKGVKRLSIKMEQLATFLCETRLNISKALNNLKEKGVIELHRKEITIPSLKALADAVKNNPQEELENPIL